jgi:uncharacterized flavoprotein (TIGR03862 family)
MAAEVLVRGGAAVTVYERMPSLGRKFLLAGRGGLNLTHSEELDCLLTRYGAAAPFLREAIEAFPPAALRAWSEELGQPTFTGTSGRVFPKTMKSSPLLRAWLRRLGSLGAGLRLLHRWMGWDASGALVFDSPAGTVTARPDATVLALGGASWPRLGPDGMWTIPVIGAGIAVSRLQPANCGFTVAWSEHVRTRFAGEPLKGIELRFGGAAVRGEILITAAGVEGGAIYALSARLRDAINESGSATPAIDLRPGAHVEDLAAQLSIQREKQSLATVLRKAARLSPAAIALMHESAIASGRPLSSMQPAELAALMKAVPLHLTGTAPLARAISTAGGIALSELDARFMVRRMPGLFAAGEMLDWEAPTGGYLLQACFATGAAAGRGVLEWLSGCRN